MKRTLCIAAFMLFWGSTCWAQTPASYSSYYEGKRYEFKVSEEMLDQSPSWSDGAATPPLSPKRALQIALQNLSTIVPNAERWRMRDIRLSPVRDKWVYIVEFSEPLLIEGELFIGPVTRFSVVVLMNGEVVKPKVTEYKFP